MSTAASTAVPTAAASWRLTWLSAVACDTLGVGTEFIAMMFGGIIERPVPSPPTNRHPATYGNEVAGDRFDSAKNEAAKIAMPTTAGTRAPILSARRPPTGIMIAMPNACGSITSPIVNAVM